TDASRAQRGAVGLAFLAARHSPGHPRGGNRSRRRISAARRREPGEDDWGASGAAAQAGALFADAAQAGAARGAAAHSDATFAAPDTPSAVAAVAGAVDFAAGEGASAHGR